MEDTVGTVTVGRGGDSQSGVLSRGERSPRQGEEGEGRKEESRRIIAKLSECQASRPPWALVEILQIKNESS